MINIAYYESPIGKLLLASKNNRLIGLWIENQKYYFGNLKEETIELDNDILRKTKKWLDRYFKGEIPSIDELELYPIGSDFQKKVWKILCDIPYGKVVTYNEIAKRLTKTKKMSAQAVGGAVGHNPISIIIPCHRVVGTSGSLTGYAGGIKIKSYLLSHEKVNMDHLFDPTEKVVL